MSLIQRLKDWLIGIERIDCLAISEPADPKAISEPVKKVLHLMETDPDRFLVTTESLTLGCWETVTHDKVTGATFNTTHSPYGMINIELTKDEDRAIDNAAWKIRGDRGRAKEQAKQQERRAKIEELYKDVRTTK